MTNTQPVTVKVPMTPRGHRKLKIVSAETGQSIGELIYEALKKIDIDVQA